MGLTARRQATRAPAPRARRSIAMRVLAVVMVAGAAGAVIALVVATRAMGDLSEVRLVEETTARVDRTRRLVADRLDVAQAQLTAAALLVEGGRAADVPATLSPFIAAALLQHDGETIAVVREPELRSALLALAPTAEPRLLGDHVVISVMASDATAVALIEVANLLPTGRDQRSELTLDRDPRLAVAPVIVERGVDRGVETATAIAAVGDHLMLRHRASLAGARAEVNAAVRHVIGWAVAVTALLMLVLAWLLARGVTRPVRALAAALRRADDAPLVLPALPDDEIGALGAAIDQLHQRLAHDARLLAEHAELARAVALASDPGAVRARLGEALERAHPGHGWTVRPPDAQAPTADGEVADVGVLRVDGDRLVLGLGAGGGEVTGHGPIDDVDRASVEVLARTAAAALRALALLAAAQIHDKLALVGRLSASVAHEMNNPLAFVGLNLALLDEQVTTEQRELVRDCQTGVDRLTRIVRDLSRLTRGGTDVVTVEDLRAVVADEVKVAQARSRGGVTVTVAPGPPVWVRCARGRIAQAVLNLLVNAIDVAVQRADGRVEVEVTDDGERGAVVVRDNGAGIPPEARARLFDPFFTTKGEGGTGLGLYLSQRFVVDQGGSLEVTATGPAGTTFTLTVPRAAAPVAAAPEPPPATATGDRRRQVLVIDDEPQIVRILERSLGRFADVTSAATVADGLAAARAGRFALILCDWNMPNCGGREFVDELQRREPALVARTVIMTGGVIDPPAGVRVVTKPLQLAQLRELIDAA